MSKCLSLYYYPLHYFSYYLRLLMIHIYFICIIENNIEMIRPKNVIIKIKYFFR